MQKINYKKILLWIFIITLILMGYIIITFKVEELKISDNPKEHAEIEELFSYSIYDNQDENNVKILVKVNSQNGIEYIEEPNGNKIYGNQKQKITFDYKLAKEQEKEFRIKEIGKAEEIKCINITDEEINNNGIKIDKIYGVDGYKTVEIKNVNDMQGVKTSYQIGKNGIWVDGEGKISIIDYDIYTTGLMNNDNTVTVTAKSEDGKGNIVTSSKKYDVNPTISTLEVEDDSLLKAIENNDFKTGISAVTVEDVTYNLKVYTYDTDLEIKGDALYGIPDDVGTASDNAKNMIVLKVNGDLTVDSGCTLSTYCGKYGGPKGFLIYCSGTLTNNGTIDMTGKGAKAEGENVYLWKNSIYETEDMKYEYVPAIGATGGAGGTWHSTFDSGTKGNNGKNGLENRKTGGGGSGGLACFAGDQYAYVTAGGTGSSYSGGPGSTGDGIYGSAAESTYGGGLLIIKSNEFVNNSNIYSNGKSGKSGAGVSGGSSGGGSINIFSNIITQIENVTANGGMRLPISYSGGAGGEGSVSIGQIVSGKYLEYDSSN